MMGEQLTPLEKELLEALEETNKTLMQYTPVLYHYKLIDDLHRIIVMNAQAIAKTRGE
jgi:hypothetical protein